MLGAGKDKRGRSEGVVFLVEKYLVYIETFTIRRPSKYNSKAKESNIHRSGDGI